MSLNLFWFIPTHGDSRYLGTSKGARPIDANYLKQVAVAPTRWATTACCCPPAAPAKTRGWWRRR
jgi:hypothetical protein